MNLYKGEKMELDRAKINDADIKYINGIGEEICRISDLADRHEMTISEVLDIARFHLERRKFELDQKRDN